SDDDFWVRVAP
nr:Chain E, Kelch repeat and BTB domain-containing protein 6 [Homo sapiens]4XC2_F Chain F, Kelch repeat and BTB domain-containing protein 6 [Homo sapiens]4XC2_G Chain G, Kelch repeat and BTB domain-containing protein 6 [Homo sapiens]4XC2_H Chain H, Kelch repeat and BTB domain-containing protein 6 [Homo sapiens]